MVDDRASAVRRHDHRRERCRHTDQPLDEPRVDVFGMESVEHTAAGLVVADDARERRSATEARHRDRGVRRQPAADDVVASCNMLSTDDDLVGDRQHVIERGLTDTEHRGGACHGATREPMAPVSTSTPIGGQGRTARTDAQSARGMPHDPVARLVRGIYSR